MFTKRLIFLIYAILIVTSLFSQDELVIDEFFDVRKELVDSLINDNRQDYIEIRNAFMDVRRDLFLDRKYQSIAYKNMPVPANGGLIHPSPEFIINILKSAQIGPLSKVLVIGQNSHFLNNLILELSENLFVIDPGLNLISTVNYENKIDMSFFGWIEEAPFDIIILFGSIEEIPLSLVSQLKIGGQLVFPFSYGTGNQILSSATKFNNGFEIKSIGDSYIHKLR